MSVLARFRVGSVEPGDYGTKVRLSALYSPEEVEGGAILEEIRSFFQATPSGQLEMFIKNEAAERQFQVGDEYYLRMDKIPHEQTVQAIYAAKAKAYQEETDGQA